MLHMNLKNPKVGNWLIVAYPNNGIPVAIGQLRTVMWVKLVDVEECL